MTTQATTEQPAPTADDVLVRVGDDSAEALATLRPRLRAHAAGGGRVAVVDVADLTRLSSATLTGLLVAKRRCRALGVRLEVRGAAPHVHGLLYRAGLVDRPLGAGAR
jgi:anti-anti-sigma regulatory factor